MIQVKKDLSSDVISDFPNDMTSYVISGIRDK